MTLQPAEPGLWRATMPADEIGLYRVEQGDKRAFAHVGAANPREFIDARSTAEKLKPLAEATGGRIARMADASGDLDLPRIVPVRSGDVDLPGSDWIGIRMTEASVLEGHQPRAALRRLPRLAVLLGVLPRPGIARALTSPLVGAAPFANTFGVARSGAALPPCGGN